MHWPNKVYDINNIAILIFDGATGSDLATVNKKSAAADAFTKAIDTPDLSSMAQTAESGRWVFHFSLAAGLRVSRPLVLIQARNLMASPSLRPLFDFARLFKLTPAEELFCRHLMAGSSLKEVAALTGITFETARSRLRTVFQKTDTHRQAELFSLLLVSRGCNCPPACRVRRLRIGAAAIT